jgi:rod shape-determining protein MreD
VTIYLVLPVLAFVALLQTTVMPHLSIWGVFPDLPVLVVAGWGLLRGAAEGSLWGFIAGLAVDLFSGAPFGAATLSLVVVGVLAGLGKASALQAQVALPMLTVFLATIGYNLIFLLVLQISGQTVVWFDSLLRIILPSAVLNAVLTPPIFGAMRWAHTRFFLEEMEW